MTKDSVDLSEMPYAGLEVRIVSLMAERTRALAELNRLDEEYNSTVREMFGRTEAFIADVGGLDQDDGF